MVIILLMVVKRTSHPRLFANQGRELMQKHFIVQQAHHPSLALAPAPSVLSTAQL
jgi:hypothetical protein